ncbi:serine-rich adhesin for platelets isoform X3 [Eurosta solidaginis]|uniref:serine-rich adhesin for platelets isoform X3 n=1 Tax=Eurosta solidaginis TaxID=178769 RepID=UPI003530BB42
MGKCISKHPSVMTIALSEKDLATANQIWSKFAESTEYIGLKDEHGNQLCEYYYVSGKKKRKKKQQSTHENEPKATDVYTIQQSTDGDNDAKNVTTIQKFAGAKQSTSKSYQNSNESQKQNANQNPSKKKSKDRKKAKVVHKQSSTLNQQQGSKSNQFTATNSSQTLTSYRTITPTTTTTENINTNDIKSYTENVWQDCITSTITEVTNVDATPTPTTTTIMYPNVNVVANSEYCTFVSTTDVDDNEDAGIVGEDNGDNDDGKNFDNDDNNKNKEHLFGIQSQNTFAEFVVVDNTDITRTITTFDAHKSQQYRLAHLQLQANLQNDGDNTIAVDANNNAKITATQQHQPECGAQYDVVQGQEEKLAAKDQTIKTNDVVFNVNIGIRNAATKVDEANAVGDEQRFGNYFAVLDDGDIEGQAESKKHLKKHGGSTTCTIGTGAGVIETKGTAMSFGFRKKLNTTPKKFKKLLEAGVGGGESKRKQDKCNNITTTTTTRNENTSNEDIEKPGTVINSADNGEMIEQHENLQDDNGNAEILAKVHFEKVGAAATTTQRFNQNTASTGISQSNSNLPGVASRFGYRGPNIVRPASAGAGLAQRSQMDIQDSAESNNNYFNNSNNNNSRSGGVGVSGQQKPLVSNLKRRSKSAHAGRALTSGDEASEPADAAGRPKISQPKSITFNLSQNSTIEYQRRQFFEQPSTYGGSYGSAGRTSKHSGTHQPTTHLSMQSHQSRNVINTGMHTNVIVRPTPRAPPATFSKFTLHTVSLPKPEFPVAISVGTPTTPGSIYTPSPTMTTTTAGARAKDTLSQHPLTVVASATVAHNTGVHMDLKSAKQMANNTRRGFSGSREISADSGISCMDANLDSSVSSACGSNGGRTVSPKRSRSRPRNLQMFMSGRHKFEVRDLDDPFSSEGSSIVEPLALPKLPGENQTVPLPLCGLMRSNTVLSRESYERNGGVFGNSSTPSTTQQVEDVNADKPRPTTAPAQCIITRNSSEESEGVDEEKLYMDRSTSEKGNRFKDINTCSSKTSSPGSSIMLSWCNAGESLAVKDCSSLSISSEDSNKLHEDGHKAKDSDTEKNEKRTLKAADDFNDDDLSGIVTDMQASTLSSLTETLPKVSNLQETAECAITHAASSDMHETNKPDRPKSFYNTLNETKFAEMALAGSTYLLDDETSPTDSLVSSTESEEAAAKQKKHKINEELQEKDLDEISPELEMASPISPGSPTHASHSLSLSDCGNLIDDEIADQPALLFNSEAHDLVDSLTSHKDKTDTPTLMENTGSIRSLKSLSKARTALQQAIELSLRTPISLRKAVMERVDSLDTLSPCESICSEDLMMDFDMHSSVDSIDRSSSIKSRSGSDLHKMGETELFSEFERKGSDVMKELNSILRQHTNKSSEKDSVIAHLPARTTRLLNRSRLQQQQYPSTNVNGPTSISSAATSGAAGGADSDSSRSTHSLRRSAAGSRSSIASTSSTNAYLPPNASYAQQKPFQHHYSQLHRDVHSSSDDLMLYDKSFRNAMIQDVLQFKKQLLRLRRILQEGEVEDRERTIRLQKNQIENLESKKPSINTNTTKECINSATQTERTRPFSYGAEGLSRSKPEYTSYTTHYHPAACCDPNSICNSATNNNICTQHKMQHHNHCNVSNNNLPANATEAALQQHQQIRRHTIISTTLSNFNQKLALAPRRASIAWETSTPATAPTPLTQTSTAIGTTTHAPTANIYKPVKITLIGEPLKQWQWNAVGNGKSAAKVKINGNSTRTISNGNNNYVDGGSGSGDCERSKDTICNGSGRNSISNLHSSDISKETINNGLKNGCNGYANGNSTKTNDCNGDGKQNVNNVVVMNGQQKLANSQLNHHSHHRHNRQIQQALLQPAQQQTHTQEASKNTYQQLQHQQQQQQKPLQCYQTASNSTNGNFNPTVTIV